jgi:hypothetical protein
MPESYSISKIDTRKFPIFLNIKNELTLFDFELTEKRFGKIESDYKRCKTKCENFRDIAIKKNDEYCANISFLLKMNFTLIRSIAKFWKSCEDYEYRDAWMNLQDALSQNRILLNHFDLEKHDSIAKSYEYLSLIEKLFPYRTFVSSGLNQLQIKCSICDKSSFDPECHHIVGNLYWGKMAYNIVEKIGSFDHIALVPNPADKRLILSDYEYDRNHPEESPFVHVYHFIKESGRPLKHFKYQIYEREIPRSTHNNYPMTWSCPCGSGTPFEECCYNKDVIKIPHYEFIFND